MIVHGVGGVGKTVTSVEYAYRYREAYDCIFYLLADTAPGLAESYGEIAYSLGLVQGNEDQNRILELSRGWLQNTGMYINFRSSNLAEVVKNISGCLSMTTSKTSN